MALSSGCEIRHGCLVWTTKRPPTHQSLTSPPFFLKTQRCQLTLFAGYYNCTGGYRFSLRIEADSEDHSNYRTSVSFELGGVTGLSTSGVFGHSHASPQTIWECSGPEISNAFPDIKPSDSYTFAVSFFSTTPGDDGKVLVPTLARAPQNDKSVQTLSYMNPCLESPSKDFAKLLDEGSDPDVEFQCADSSIKAHKNVLCTRLPVFASMLKSDMVESKTGLLKIQDMTLDILEQLVLFLSTGRIDKLTVDTAMSLYVAGVEHEVKELTARCAEFLTDNLKVDNACEVLALSYAHSDTTLTDAAIAYILAKKVHLMDDQWPSFCKSHPEIAVEVFNRYCKLVNNAPPFE